MEVREVMCTKVETCRRSANLAEAALIMWNNDCGIVPVVDEERRVVGMITDRDICMAAATRQRHPGDIRVADVISGEVHGVHAATDLRDALDLMKREQVRRLPVTDGNGVIEGVLSLNDVIQSVSTPRRRAQSALTAADVLDTLKSIGQRQAAEVAR